MSLPVFKPLLGAVDGSNVFFNTPDPYQAGSVRVFRNGVLLEGSQADGWTEIGGTALQLNEAPKPDDVMQAFYIVAI